MLAVGAFNDGQSEGTTAGSVFLYERQEQSWEAFDILRLEDDGEAGDLFGHSVSMNNDGSIVAVGAPGRNTSSPPSKTLEDAGAAYIFNNTNDSMNRKPIEIRAEHPNAHDRFGWDIALADDGALFVAGAWREDGDTAGVLSSHMGSADETPNSGAAYVFSNYPDEGSWVLRSYVKAPEPDEDDFFGGRVAMSDDGRTLAVGAWGEDGSSAGVGRDIEDNESPGSGAIFIY